MDQQSSDKSQGDYAAPMNLALNPDGSIVGSMNTNAVEATIPYTGGGGFDFQGAFPFAPVFSDLINPDALIVVTLNVAVAPSTAGTYDLNGTLFSPGFGYALSITDPGTNLVAYSPGAFGSIPLQPVNIVTTANKEDIISGNWILQLNVNGSIAIGNPSKARILMWAIG